MVVMPSRCLERTSPGRMRSDKQRLIHCRGGQMPGTCFAPVHILPSLREPFSGSIELVPVRVRVTCLSPTNAVFLGATSPRSMIRKSFGSRIFRRVYESDILSSVVEASITLISRPRLPLSCLTLTSISTSTSILSAPYPAMQLPSLSLASVVLLLAGHAAAAPIASLHARSTGCNVHNHFYNEVAVYYPPSDHACGNTLLSTLRNKGLSVTKWKCENSTATFRLPIVATSVTTLATAIGHSCDTCVGGSGTDGTLWAQVLPDGN